MAKAKTINLLLNEGSLEGVISMEDSSWNKGELYSAPRKSVEDLISTDACSRYGVYLLLSEDKVYVGQASDLSKRIKQHIIGKSWWERVVVLTTSDDSLNRADLDYIESILIEKASRVGRLDCDNKNIGNKQKLSRFREVEIQQYLEEALFLLELIGINVFKEISSKSKSKSESELISSIANVTENQRAIREKKEAIQFLNDNGIIIGKNTNYAKRQDDKLQFWLNPKTYAPERDWVLILNDQFRKEIILISVPAGTFVMRAKDKKGLVPRHDRPDRIDLEICSDTLIDVRSNSDFGKYVVKRINY